MKNERVVLTTSFNVGIGLWTSLCVFFARIAGVTSYNFKKKQDIVMEGLVNTLKRKIARQTPHYKPIEIELWFNGPLNATISLTLEKAEKMYDTHIIFYSNNVGLGLWTSICESFADMTGTTSERYLDKMDSIVEEKTLYKKDKEYIQHLIRKPSAFNIVEVYLYRSEYIKPVEIKEPEQNNVNETATLSKESTVQVEDIAPKAIELVDKASLKVGDVVFVVHHEYNEFAKKALNPGDKVIVKEIDEDSVIVQVDKEFYSFMAEVQFDNLRR